MTPVRRMVRRFLRNEEGALSPEFVVVFPLLLWVYMAMFVFWDAFRTQSVNTRATETISDLLSRETRPLNAAYLDGMHQVFDWLTLTTDPTGLRISVVAAELDEGGEKVLRLKWSHGASGYEPHIDVSALEPHIPLQAVGDQVIVVETFMSYEAIFSVGVPNQTFRNISVTRPRFVPQVLWDGGGAGV